MNFKLGINFLKIAVVTLVSAQASAGDENTLKAMKPLIEYLRPLVFEIELPTAVYHWTGSRGFPNPLSSQDPSGLEYVKLKSRGYWLDKGKLEISTKYGPGLYAAVDPAATRSYGGQKWLLVEMKLPKGFRYLNLFKEMGKELPKPVRAVFKGLGCPASWNDSGYDLNTILGPKNGASEKCIDALKTVFNDQLKIDGFFYFFSASYLSRCAETPAQETGFSSLIPDDPSFAPGRRVALVVTSDRWIRPELIKVFDETTVDDASTRLMIQSFFYLVAHEEAALDDSKSGRVPPFPARINSAEPPKTSDSKINGSYSLLWKDLDQMITDSGLDAWIDENLFGCSSALKYKTAR